MHRQHQYQRLAGAGDNEQDNEDNPSIHNNSNNQGTSFLRHSTASVTNATHSPVMAHDPPPLMPLFTPVLQDFQNRFGSSILQQQQHPEEEEDDEQDDLDNRVPDFRETFEDPVEADEHDVESSARRSLLFGRMEETSDNVLSSERHGKKPLFTNPRLHSASPFAFDLSNSSSNARHAHGGASRLRPNLDLGTDHEAPASLMIEMNQQNQDEDDSTGYWNFGDRARRRLGYKRPGMNAAELAMWKWVNVENLDNFLAKVYDYYVGKGMYTILLERCLNLLTFAFVIGFSTFLIGCVDYPRLRHSKHLDQVLIPQCIHQLSTGTFVVLLLFATFWIGQVTRLVYDIPEMVDMCNFYTYLLQIPDEDIQTVSWHEVVTRIIKIRDNNPNTSTLATIQTTDMQRLNAHDIANRIMRKENFMIAMFNKELIDLSVPLPLMRNRTILTRILEWSLSFCILGYVFDERGQVRKRFLKDTRRPELVEGLRRRFQFMGLATLVFSPLISIYLILYFFFRYFEEYHKNPSSIGTRQYTPLAKWKFKEFNELPHLFAARINASYPLAMKYINQFPKEKTILICRFVAFVSGSFAAVLALMTIFDQELLLGLEITTEKTVFFYLGVFGSIMAVSRGMIPDQTESFDPELLLRGVVEHTHYMPNEWRDKLHTDEVRKQFALLFEYNAMLFLMEFMSLVLTPLILCFSLPSCSEKVIDFFREFTVHVDGVGYVCSFAVFDFKRHGNVKYGAPAATTDERFVSNEGKMEKSFLNFKQNNPDWEPNDPEGSMYLSKLLEAEPSLGQGRARHTTHHHQQSTTWGQGSAFMRSRNTAYPYKYSPERNFHLGRSRLGRSVHMRDNDISDKEDVDAREYNGQTSGVRFYHNARHQNRARESTQLGDIGSESSGYDDHQDEDGHNDKGLSVGQGFTSNLGDSFVSEIGQSSSRPRTRTERGGHGRGEKDHDGQRDPDELSDSGENERESRKKGVFGLLNQIYEMNNVTM
ncbi:autophagy protein atg9 [Haplosporangium sp. Z 767]|nr:autophagy protein atg9 [Haplosporangium sp. Z 11]KAF9188802.1 autophagy protein atg9 [Haplosporangium sp. Z 767]